MPGTHPGGNVDWRGQHCRFCRFFTFVSTSDPPRPPHSSLLTACGNVTVRVLGGKSGKIRRRNGNRWHGGRQKRHGLTGMGPCPGRSARGCQRARPLCFARSEVVQVRVRMGGRAVIELIYHEEGGMSRSWGEDCRMIPLRADGVSFVDSPARWHQSSPITAMPSSSISASS